MPDLPSWLPAGVPVWLPAGVPVWLIAGVPVWLPAWLPPGVLATVALSASSVLLGFGLPLAAGLAILGLVRGFVEERWREFVLGMLLVVALVAAGAALRIWGAGVAAGAELG